MTHTIPETQDSMDRAAMLKERHDESLQLMKDVLTLINDKHPASIMAALTHTLGMVGASMYKDKDEFMTKTMLVVSISYDREAAMEEKEENGGTND